MKPSTRTCQATRLLLELAHNLDAPPLRAAALSLSVGISVKLLEKIVRPLKSAGLLKGVRGALGGYVLGRAPEAISLADVLTAMEGAVFKPQCCEADADCQLMCDCPAGNIWIGLARHVELKFRDATLADLMDKPLASCTSRLGRAGNAACAPGAPGGRQAPGPAKSGLRIARRRKPGSWHGALRLHPRPRPA